MINSENITNKWMKAIIERLAQSLNSPENKEWIQMFLIEPFLSYILDRCFSYFVIGAIIFGFMLLLIISTFILLLLKFKNNNAYMIHLPNTAIDVVKNVI
jgi:hypothetical protein